MILKNLSSSKLSRIRTRNTQDFREQYLFLLKFLPSSLDTSCSRPCTCRGEDHTSPSWRLARRQTWWSLPRTAAHGMPSLQRWLVHRRSTWSGCVGMAPSWFGTLASESNHPIIQSSRLQTNPPKLEVTQQQGFMTRLYVFWTKKLSDVHVQCTVKASSEKQVATSQVRLNFDVQNSWITARILRTTVNQLSEGRREAVKLEMIWAINLFRLV